MVLQKKNTSEIKDMNWFPFAMGLSRHLFSDYVSLKTMFQMETLAFAPSNLVGMAEVAEKSFKLYLAMHEKLENSLSHYSNKYGHNLEKLRAQASEYDGIFNDDDIKQFTKPFGDRRGALYQNLRYGSEKTIDGFSTNFGVLMPIVEKIFFNSVLRLEEDDKKMVNNSSLLRFLIVDSDFHQSNNRDVLIQAIQANNLYFAEYAEYSWDIENEQNRILAAIRQHEANNCAN